MNIFYASQADAIGFLLKIGVEKHKPHGIQVNSSGHFGHATYFVPSLLHTA